MVKLLLMGDKARRDRKNMGVISVTDIRKIFLSEFGKTFSSDTRITSADNDMRFAVEMQKKRIAQKGLWLDYDFIPRGHNNAGRNYNDVFTDGKYAAHMSSGTCTFKRVLKKGDRLISLKKLPANIWLMIMDVKNGDRVGDDIYICPNCGKPSPIKELIEGCRSCGTRFKMDELYPKVSNYNIVRDYSMDKSEIFPKYILPAILFGLGAIVLSIIGILIALAAGIGSYLKGGSTEGSQMVMGVFATIIGGAPVYGFMGAGLFIFGRLIFDALKAMPLLQAQRTRTLFENVMKPYGQEYMPDFFIGRTIGKVKTVIFSDNPSELPFYKGKDLPSDAKDMVDIVFRGAFRFDKVEVSGSKAVVEGEIYSEVLYANGKNSNRNIGVRLVKDVTKKHGLDFSISTYQCPSCAASFDAYRNKFCPYCGHEYDMENDDWVIEYIR